METPCRNSRDVVPPLSPSAESTLVGSSAASPATPPLRHRNDTTRRVVHLDRERPGDWAVHHHFNSLITRLEDHRPSSLHSAGQTRTLTYPRPLSVEAIKDHDYMESRSQSLRDPFLATGEFAIDNYVLNCNIDPELADSPDIELDPSITPWEYLDSPNSNQVHEPICGTRGRNVKLTWHRGFRDRIVLAAVGGAFLVGPMWLMVLQSGVYTSLISTTAFVVCFGILMAYFLHEGKDVLGSTAAYAAVLVVFVGTSTAMLQ